MGQMSPAGEVHAHKGVPRLQQGRIGRQICLGSGMGLHIGVLCAEKRLGPVNGQPLNLVHIFASAVIPPPGIALGVLVGQATAHGGHHRRGGDVFRGDELNILLLPLILPPQPCGHLPILPGQIVHAFLQKILHGVVSPIPSFPFNILLQAPCRKTKGFPAMFIPYAAAHHP